MGPRAGGDLFLRGTCLGTMGPCLRRDLQKMLNYTSKVVSD